MRIHALNRIKAIQLKHLSPGKLIDGGGLQLITRSTGSSFWQFRWRIKTKDSVVGLGSLKLVGLPEARAKAAICRQAVAVGKHPKEALIAETVKDTSGPTFEEVAIRYIDSHKTAWKSEEHGKQWESTLKVYVYPTFKGIPIKDLTKHDIYKVIAPIWLTKNPTARKLRGRIEMVFDYALGLDLYVGMNPALWRGNLKALLPEAKKVHKEVHHESLDYHDLPKLVSFLRERIKSPRSPNSAKGLLWLILSAGRYSEVSGAKFPEVDLRRNIWVIPAERMKNGQEHWVPLTPPMVQLFAQLCQERVCDYMFPGVARKDAEFQPMSENTMTKYLQTHTKGKPTAHGLRATFKDWALENTKYPDFLSEAQLSHAVGDAVRQAYVHTDLIEQRRAMMNQYASFAIGELDAGPLSVVE